MRSPEASKSNFHTRRLSEQKVANMMIDTYSRVSRDMIIDSGPTKFDAFKKKSQSIVSPKSLALPIPIGAIHERNYSVAENQNFNEDYDEYAEALSRQQEEMQQLRYAESKYFN